MSQQERVYQLALTQIPLIGSVHARTLIQQFGSASAIFNRRKRELELVEGIGSVRAGSIKSYCDFSRCEQELVYMDQHQINPVFITENEFPKRLQHCYDGPVLLFTKGCLQMNPARTVGVIGTRQPSEYGRAITEQLIQQLQQAGVTIISGLAYGIDTIAHKAALHYDLPTIGVLGHGLDQMYPASNRQLARQMLGTGGLITEFMSGTAPDRQNFPKRNRIVAGLCDALIVIETGIRGGSMITAELATSYNRDVFAVPGRITDSLSEGGNSLIQNHKAALVTNAHDILENMNWLPVSKAPAAPVQTVLFADVSKAAEQLLQWIKQQGRVSVDTIFLNSQLTSNATAAALMELELNGLLTQLPGKIYYANH